MGNELEKKKIGRAKIILFAVILIAVLLPQLIGTTEQSGEEQEAVPEYTTMEELADKRLVIVAGEYGEGIIDEYIPDVERIYVNSQSEQALSIQQGKADACIVSGTTAGGLLEEYSSLTSFDTGVEGISAAFATQKTAEGQALAEEYDDFMAEMKANGEFDRMVSRWFEAESEDVAIPEYTYSGEKGSLKIAASVYTFPYSYIQNGEITGYEIDLIDAFCAWAGYTPKMENVEFVSALSGLTAGKYDFIATSIVVTEERAESMTFTVPHFTDQVVAIVRNTATGETASVPKASHFFTSMATSFEKNFIRENRWKMMLRGLGVTILLAVAAAFFGTILGMGICFLGRCRNSYAKAAAQIYVRLFQGIPLVVLLLVIYYLIFAKADISALVVCILGFSLDFAAYVSEIIRSGIEAVPKGQWRAAEALGFTRTQAFVKIIFPQALKHILPVYRGQFVAMVKMTSIAGYISVEDLTKVSDMIRSRTFEAFFPLITTAVIYFVLAAALASSFRLLERKTDIHLRDRQPKGVKL